MGKIIDILKIRYILRIMFTIFFVVAVYYILNAIRVFKNDSIKTYQVLYGEILNADRNKGFIFRDEYVEKSEADGFINYYVTNTEKVSRGKLIYTIDNTKNPISNAELDDKGIKKINKKILEINNNITDDNFYYVYVLKDELFNTINEYQQQKQNELVDIASLKNSKYVGASKYSGIVSFFTDGYEGYACKDYDNTFLTSYKKNGVIALNDKVNSGDSICKIITNPEYTIVFDSDLHYDDNKNVTIKLLNENLVMNGIVNKFIDNKGREHYAITVIDYLDKLINKRVVDFEIINKSVSGYKIPLKSIVTKKCYVIPKNMFIVDNDLDAYYLYKLGQNGKKQKISLKIVKSTDEYYYVSVDDNKNGLNFGDTIVNNEGSIFSLSDVSIIEGVYNMNRGYAVFKGVEIIEKTDEYAILNTTSSGISSYDYIALNANELTDGKLISN